MYYYSEIDGNGPGQSVGLPVTPSVALRSLHDQIRVFLSKISMFPGLDLYSHIEGAIEPPRLGNDRSFGDNVSLAITDYAAKIVGRSDLLTSQSVAEQQERIAEHGRLTREMFALEHSLAIDLGRLHPNEPLQERESFARMTLSIAAFWFDRRELIGLGQLGSHPLLGQRPSDAVGASLFDFADASFRVPVSALPLSVNVDSILSDVVITADLVIGQ